MPEMPASVSMRICVWLAEGLILMSVILTLPTSAAARRSKGARMPVRGRARALRKNSRRCMIYPFGSGIELRISPKSWRKLLGAAPHFVEEIQQDDSIVVRSDHAIRRSAEPGRTWIDLPDAIGWIQGRPLATGLLALTTNIGSYERLASRHRAANSSEGSSLYRNGGLTAVNEEGRGRPVAQVKRGPSGPAG